jgi:hypothetical protein
MKLMKNACCKLVFLLNQLSISVSVCIIDHDKKIYVFFVREYISMKNTPVKKKKEDK